MRLTTPRTWDGIPGRSRTVNWSKLWEPEKKAYWAELLDRKEWVDWDKDVPDEYSDKYFVFIQSKEWEPFIDGVNKRSKGLCERCNDGVTRARDVHHKIYARKYSPNLTDLEHLCASCHDEELQLLAAERDGNLVGDNKGCIFIVKTVVWTQLKSGRGQNTGEIEVLPVLYFREITKGLVIRKVPDFPWVRSNEEVIKKLFGSPEKGIGKQVILRLFDGTMSDGRVKPLIKIYGVSELYYGRENFVEP
jgi:hypothetical protein